MTRSPLLFGTLLSLILAPLAGAHTHPAKAKTLESSLVQTYAECTAPNATTTSGRPACEASAEVDPGCLFSHDGVGLLTAVVKGTGIKVRATLRDLEPTCNGATLQVLFRVRTTTHCPNEHCTTVDEDLISTASCTVTDGKCTIKDTIPTGFPAGDGSAMQILSCGVRRGELQAFSCGVLVP